MRDLHDQILGLSCFEWLQASTQSKAAVSLRAISRLCHGSVLEQIFPDLNLFYNVIYLKAHFVKAEVVR